MVGDAASMSVMIETIGCRNDRWLQRKSDDFITRLEQQQDGSKLRSNNNNNGPMPRNIVRQNSRVQHAISSMSSSSGSSTGNRSLAETEDRQVSLRRKDSRAQQQQQRMGGKQTDSSSSSTSSSTKTENICEGKPSAESTSTETKQVTPSSGSSNATRSNNNDFHDYHAPSLPDPLLDFGCPGSDSPRGESDDNTGGEGSGGNGRDPMCTDSSSGEDEKMPLASSNNKKRKGTNETNTQPTGTPTTSTAAAAAAPSATGNHLPYANLPANIARSGGILHNVRPIAPAGGAAAHVATGTPSNGIARLKLAPATTLPPFAGIGKRATAAASTAVSNSNPSVDTGGTGNQSSSGDGNVHQTVGSVASSERPLSVVNVANKEQNSGSNSNSRRHNEGSARSSYRTNIISYDNDTTSSSQGSSTNQKFPRIHADYHVNEDHMIITDDIVMCPFIFRSQDAVWFGALAECIMPGMLRARFSSTNKLKNVEMIFDAMGFCQQLERASANESTAQIIPNSLEMALTPNSDEARVITLAKHPYPIVSVNEAWTRVTGYTQMDGEGKDLSLLNGKRTDVDAGKKNGKLKPLHDLASVADGRCACSTNIHYDKNGTEFVDFVSSYPLTNLNNEVTHILHVYQDLPGPVCHDHPCELR